MSRWRWRLDASRSSLREVARRQGALIPRRRHWSRPASSLSRGEILIHRRELLVAGAWLGLAPATAWSKPPLGPANLVVDAFVKAQGFQGVVMLGRAGKPHYARAFGMADIEKAKP